MIESINSNQLLTNCTLVVFAVNYLNLVWLRENISLMVKTNQNKIVGHCDTLARIYQRSNYSSPGLFVKRDQRYLNEIRFDFCKCKKRNYAMENYAMENIVPKASDINAIFKNQNSLIKSMWPDILNFDPVVRDREN